MRSFKALRFLCLFITSLKILNVLAEDKKASVSEKLLEYAETRANNAESELSKFKKQHEDSMAACAEIKAVKSKEIELCKTQSEEFRKLYNQCQEKKSILERDLMESRELVDIEVNKCEMKHKQAVNTPHSNAHTSKQEENTLKRIQDVISDIFLLYQSSFQMILSYIPKRVKTQSLEMMQDISLKANTYWEKYTKVEYPTIGQGVDTLGSYWELYIHPSMQHVWDITVYHYGSQLWAFIEMRLNETCLDPWLVSNMENSVYSKLPSSLFGRLLILLILIAMAYYTARFCIYYILCRVLCCRRRCKKLSKKKKLFTADQEKSMTPQKLDLNNMKKLSNQNISRSDIPSTDMDDHLRRRK